MPINLRDYQEKFKNNLIKKMEKYNSIVGVMPCGGGKTIIQGSIAKDFINQNKSVVYLVHRKELIEQTIKSFNNLGINNEKLFKAMSPRMFIKNIINNNVPQPDLILIDEAHTNLSAYDSIFRHFPDTLKIGFTATPTRLKEGGLGKIFKDIVESVSVNWLIENKFLSPFKYFSKPIINRDDITVEKGEFSQRKSGLLISTDESCFKIVSEWERLANNKKTMVYCPDITSSKKIIDFFQKKGFSAKHLDGNTNKNDRDIIVQEFREGKIKILSNAMLFSEGYDDKEIECIILLRPTLSYALYIQQAMRGMRYKEGKTCVILDFVDNWTTHGLPDMERLFDLEDKANKTSRNNASSVSDKSCPSCSQILKENTSKCDNCGFKFQIKPKENYEVLRNNLNEITSDDVYKNLKLHNFKPKNLEDVVKFCKAKKYKNGWIFHFCEKNNIPIYEKDLINICEMLGYKKGWIFFASQKYNIMKNLED